MSAMTAAARELRRPIVLGILSVMCLVAHHILLRRLAHGSDAHVFLSHGGSDATTALILAFVAARFVAYLLVPGLLLAAGAEIVAYVLVGPRRTVEEEEAEHGSYD